MAVLDSGTSLVILGSLVGILLAKKLIQILTGPKLPPGPIPYPFIGNIPQLSSRPEHSHLTMQELANKYGDIFTISIFNTKFIIFNTHEIVREVFIKNADSFSTRPESYSIRLVFGNDKGLIWQAGDAWKGLRKIVFASLRNLGTGKNLMEGKILEEAATMSEVISQHDGKPFDPSQLVSEASSNVTCSVCFGSRFDYSNKQFRSLVDKLLETVALGSRFEPVDHFPIMRLFPLPKRMKKQIENMVVLDAFIKRQIEEHRATFDKNNLRDFIDMYLDKQGEYNQEDELFSENNISGVIKDLFFAGIDTISASIRWAMIYMLHYPEIQTKLGKEMEEVVGNERQPSLNDRVSLNYLHAFIMEILRHACVAYMTVPHTCTTDTQIQGYTIPKGATVMPNIYHIHMSERYWKNPTQFNPDRFIDTNGKFMNIKDGFLPFGAGPRLCIGGFLAQSQLFLSLACLIQKFTFKPVDENNLPPLLGKAGFTLAPEQFKIRAIPK